MADIVLKWKGAEFRIPDKRAFEIGEQVEDIVTLTEIASWGTSPKFFKIAKCFGAMLRFAGCRVSDAEVHKEMMAGVKAGTMAEDLVAAQAIAGLIAVLMDGAPDGESEGEAGEISAS